MKNTLRLFVFIVGVSLVAHSATPHSAVLTWTASADAAANPSLTYNLYRLNGACPATAPTAAPGGFTKQNATPVTTTTYTDSTVAPGVYCYFATATLNGVESVPSNTAQASIPVQPPTSFGVSSQQ